jgi:hypothetical protein
MINTMSDIKPFTFVDHIERIQYGNGSQTYKYFTSMLGDISITTPNDLQTVENIIKDIVRLNTVNTTLPAGATIGFKYNELNKEYYDYFKELISTSKFELSKIDIKDRLLYGYVKYGDSLNSGGASSSVSSIIQTPSEFKIVSLNKLVNNDKEVLIDIFYKSLLRIFKTAPILDYITSINKTEREYTNALSAFINKIEVEKIIEEAFNVGVLGMDNNMAIVNCPAGWNLELAIRATVSGNTSSLDLINYAFMGIIYCSYLRIIYAMGKLKSMGYIPGSYVPFSVVSEAPPVLPYVKPDEYSQVSLQKDVILYPPVRVPPPELSAPPPEFSDQSQEPSAEMLMPSMPIIPLAPVAIGGDESIFTPMRALSIFLVVLILGITIYLILLFVSK